MLKAGAETTISKHHPVTSGSYAVNPFDSDSESDYSDPSITKTVSKKFIDKENENQRAALFDSYSGFSAKENRYKKDILKSGVIKNQSSQELENYAVYKAEETTQSVNNCLKIAEDIREDAIRTLTTLDHQGEQITRTHQVAAEIDHDLSRGEKLLASLGGIFSRSWKPKMTRPIMGPVLFRDIFLDRKAHHLEQREKLELSATSPQGRPNNQLRSTESSPAIKKIEAEKAKQDDTLSDLSNLLGQLKEMAVDMGSEIERHSKGLEHMQDDVDELNFRMKGANERGRRLLGK